MCVKEREQLFLTALIVFGAALAHAAGYVCDEVLIAADAAYILGCALGWQADALRCAGWDVRGALGGGESQEGDEGKEC